MGRFIEVSLFLHLRTQILVFIKKFKVLRIVVGFHSRVVSDIGVHYFCRLVFLDVGPDLVEVFEEGIV